MQFFLMLLYSFLWSLNCLKKYIFLVVDDVHIKMIISLLVFFFFDMISLTYLLLLIVDKYIFYNSSAIITKLILFDS